MTTSAFGVEHSDEIAKSKVKTVKVVGETTFRTTKRSGGIIRGASEKYTASNAKTKVKAEHYRRAGSWALKPLNRRKVSDGVNSSVSYGLDSKGNPMTGGLTAKGKTAFVGLPAAGVLAGATEWKKHTDNQQNY